MLKITRYIYIVLLLAITACSATKYVPEGKYLLSKNELELTSHKPDKKNKINSAEFKLSKDVVEEYIQQRPNKRLLWMDLPLTFYNATDTAKNSWWHKFWRNTAGQAPVIYDSSLTEKSCKEIDLYLISNGYFNAKISDTVDIKKRKATLKYDVITGKPYTIAEVKYDIADKFLEQVLSSDTSNTLIKRGIQFQSSILENERSRMTNYLRDEGFWSFGINYISYDADSTVGNNRVNLTVKIRQRTERIGKDGKEILSNHPIYRLNRIVVNTFYDPSATIESEKNMQYDSIEYNGVVILYEKTLTIRAKILVEAIRLSPNEIFNQTSVTRTSENLRRLNYSANILFSPVTDSGQKPIMVTLSDPSKGDVSTTEQQLSCFIQCTPSMRHSFTTEFEASTTSDYYSLALSLGYGNRNLLRGAENFNISFRGAYEFMKSSNSKNAYEFGVTASLTAPRFWLPISSDKASLFKNPESKVSLSYSIQRRPYYHRTLVSGVYGYGWTFKNGAKFGINPADINVVSVPWVDETFIATIENPYLRNSYESQLIAGASTYYYYNTNTNTSQDNFAVKINADVNGNLFYGLTSLFGTANFGQFDDRYYTLFGLRFAQYVRATAEVNGRVNMSPSTQFAWRALIAGGYAYGNSNTVPFERLFYAGGSNSMRGWQVRTLGPGSISYDRQEDSYPNQLGDMRLEVNAEIRQHLIYGLSLAVFFDAGNIWMNSKGEQREDARFKFNRFYKQIALNTGAGLRYNIADMLILRLDWGLKLHNPNMPEHQRWFKNLGINETALHFAIGLPF